MRARLARECAQGAAVDLEQCPARQPIDEQERFGGIIRAYRPDSFAQFVDQSFGLLGLLVTLDYAELPSLNIQTSDDRSRETKRQRCHVASPRDRSR